MPSVNANAVQNNPFQPDLQFRGFTASPLIGNVQVPLSEVPGARDSRFVSPEAPRAF